MTRADDEAETAREAERFRPNSRPFAIAVGANFLLAAMCLGAPYLRGQLHAKASLGAFSRFAECLYGGEARSGLGLGLPASADAQFASTFLRAGSDWPGRCRAALDLTAPPDVIFVWPSVKQGGAEVRAAVPLVRAEIQAAARARSSVGSGRVPTRMLGAVERLRAGLTLLARAAGMDEALDQDAIAFAHAPPLAQPARLPLYAGASAALSVRADEDAFEAVALDGGGISWLRVANGQIERRRHPRSSLVRAVLGEEDGRHLVWAMPAERCLEKEDRCVQRAMGVAPFKGRESELPTPTWLAAHPAGRVDRSVRAHGTDAVDVLALRSRDRDLEVRRFSLKPDAALAPNPPATPDADTTHGAKAPPRPPLARFSLPERPTDALLLPDAVAYAVASEGHSTAILWAYADAAGVPTDAVPAPVSTIAGTRAWLVHCDAGRTRWLAHGTEAALAITRLDPPAAPSGTEAPARTSDAQASAPNPTDVPAAMPVAFGLDLGARPDDPAHDRVRLLCRSDALTLLALDLPGALSLVRCDEARCDAPRRLATDVAGFAAVEGGDGVVVAVTGTAHPEIIVHRTDARGAPLGKGVTPAVCWDPLGGMCGQPVLVAARGRLVLGARDGADLLSLESLDQGQTWIAMRGLQVGGAGDADAVMRQHRRRHAGRE